MSAVASMGAAGANDVENASASAHLRAASPATTLRSMNAAPCARAAAHAAAEASAAAAAQLAAAVGAAAAVAAS